MVKGWYGIMAMLSVVECALLLTVLNLFGWGAYVACCILTVANSFSLFGLELHAAVVVAGDKFVDGRET